MENSEKISKEEVQIQDEKSESVEKKMEICYTCGKEFDMNSDEGAHYHYGEFPMCGYCSEFYGFYQEDLSSKSEKE